VHVYLHNAITPTSHTCYLSVSLYALYQVNMSAMFQTAVTSGPKPILQYPCDILLSRAMHADLGYLTSIDYLGQMLIII
jgi:hypothetical protein